MKLNYEITIDAGIDAVWAAFDNTDNMGRWQRNFHSYTHISGRAGEPGAVAELVFDEKGKKVVLQETVTERRKPDLLAGIYESKRGSTIVVNHFEAVDASKTRWSSWCNFTFTGFTKFMSPFIGSMISKRTEGDMQRFKLMVESDEANKQS